MHKQFRSREDIRREKWDDLCQKAVPLHEQGMAYPEIAKHLSCHVTNLRQELKKRGLWKGFSADQLRMQRAEKGKERWDTLCKQAVILHEQGMGYTEIGRELGCPRAKLEVELKKTRAVERNQFRTKKRDSTKEMGCSMRASYGFTQ
ncbi:sigma-70, region 4 family protein [Bacillus pseudomycoides]|nr:sigma-70, region 4 family protein [Bacillus pseudomycoides]